MDPAGLRPSLLDARHLRGEREHHAGSPPSCARGRVHAPASRRRQAVENCAPSSPPRLRRCPRILIDRARSRGRLKAQRRRRDGRSDAEAVARAGRGRGARGRRRSETVLALDQAIERLACAGRAHRAYRPPALLRRAERRGSRRAARDVHAHGAARLGVRAPGSHGTDEGDSLPRARRLIASGTARRRRPSRRSASRSSRERIASSARPGGTTALRPRRAHWSSSRWVRFCEIASCFQAQACRQRAADSAGTAVTRAHAGASGA